MKKVLIVFFSLTGNTEMMAQYIAEGVRFSGQNAVVKKISDVSSASDLNDYDGYIFGSPTHHSDVPQKMKSFLLLAKGADIDGKPAGAFGSYTHDGNAPAMIFETLQNVNNMPPFELGSINFKDTMLENPDRGDRDGSRYVAGEVYEVGQGIKACQDYGRVFGEKLSA
jgi:flavorubredoxin